MRFFEFKKYFFDIYSDETGYLLFFISILKIGRINNSYLQVHSACLDSAGNFSQRKSLKTKLKLITDQSNQVRFIEGIVKFEEESIKIYLASADFKIDLNYTSSHSESGTINPLLIKTSKNTSLTWIPIQIKGRVKGSITSFENILNYNNSLGYVDLVETSILPTNLHLQKLLWGRLHHKDVDLTYSMMILNNNKTESLLILQFNGSNIEFSNIDYQIQSNKTNSFLNLTYPDRIRLIAKNDLYSITIDLFDHKELIINKFMDSGDRYNKAFFWLLKCISNNPRGIKFLTKANIILEESNYKSEFNNLPMINEFVSFIK